MIGCVCLNHVNHVTYSSWTALTCDGCDCPDNNRCTTQQPRILGHSFIFDLGDTKKRGPPTPRHVFRSHVEGLRIPLALIWLSTRRAVADWKSGPSNGSSFTISISLCTDPWWCSWANCSWSRILRSHSCFFETCNPGNTAFLCAEKPDAWTKSDWPTASGSNHVKHLKWRANQGVNDSQLHCR